MSWRTLSTELVVDNRFVKVQKNDVLLPDGAEIKDFYTVTIPESAAIAAITAEGKFLLITEYRYSQDCDLIEIPAGVFDPGESDPLAVAKRELLEETGYESTEWTYLGPSVESSSKLTNNMHLFFANNCVKTTGQHLDANEHLDVMEVSVEETVAMIMDGRIRCNDKVQ